VGEHRGEKTARERGAQYQIGRPGGSADRLKDPQGIPPAVLAWRSTLSESLGSKITRPLDWDENLDAPYFTGRPGWTVSARWSCGRPMPSIRRCASRPRCPRSGTTIPP